MGFENRSKNTFITILDGKFCIRVPEGTPGAVTRTNKEGRVVHEIFHDAFSAHLIAVRITESDQYGKSWNFDFEDKTDGKVYTLQLSVSNSYAINFVKMLPNIDLSKKMKLSPSLKIVDGKKKSSLFVNQDDKPIKHAYTKENPNGLPPLVLTKFKGNDAWDDTDMVEFLINMVETKIVPQLESIAPANEGTQTQQGTVQADDEELGDGDEPF